MGKILWIFEYGRKENKMDMATIKAYATT